MSAAAASRPVSAPSPSARPAARPAPRLSVVEVPLRARSSVAFVIVCLVVLVGTMLASLLLNIAMIDGSFTKSTLQRQIATAAQTHESLSTELDTATAPETLAAKAEALGMVVQAAPRMLRLSDGVVIGVGAGQ